MKKTLLFVGFSIFSICGLFAQSGKYWRPVKDDSSLVKAKSTQRAAFPVNYDLYQLDFNDLSQNLYSINDTKNAVRISLPNTKGEFETFEVVETSNFDEILQARFPEIRSYTGKSLSTPGSTLKLSLSPQGIQTMIFRTGRVTEFMEPYTTDARTYVVYESSRVKGKLPWSCSVEDKIMFDGISDKVNPNQIQSSLGELKTMRLAQSCTAEYSNYFGATSAAQVNLVLAGFNATLTRCNGVYERELGVHLNIINQSTNVIYYAAATDPYSDAATGTNPANANNANGWNIQLQNTLNTSLTGPATTLAANNAAYDIGHLFGASGGGGNAGCIGCVCTNPTANGQKQKGSGYTSPGDAIPQGDNFDIDYVVHEVGHQLGANHTFSYGNEGSGVNMEVGSGVTIMGYAGITNQDVAPHSIEYYHTASINQIQTNLATKTCPVTQNVTANNATPVANAGLDYTIPMSTPFMLTGSATDANGGDVLTYCWEQIDNASGTQTGASSAASATKASGPNFRNYSPTTSTKRYFPTLSSVMNNSTTTPGTDIVVEALSSVARTLNFRLTVRDNATYSGTAPYKVGQTHQDDMVVTVDATKGPLTVTSQNTAGISYPLNSTQNVTWTVNNTNTIAGGANVDILLTTDNGATWTTLLSNTPNDGAQAVTFTTGGAFCRLMVKATGNIFFNVNSQNFAVGYTITTSCNTFTNNTPLAVPDGTGANVSGGTVTKTVSATGFGASDPISDVNVTLASNHTYFWDLEVSLIHPDATAKKLANHICNNASAGGVNVTFDDAGAAVVCTGSPISGTITPSEALNGFNGKTANGTWTLSAFDWYNGDTGSLNNFSVQICTQQALTSDSFNNDITDLLIFPNPNNGSFTINFESNTDNTDVKVFDIRGRVVFEKEYSSKGLFQQTINLNNAQSGVYLVNVKDGSRQITKKIVIE